MTKKKIQVDNPNGLPTVKHDKLVELQGDLKYLKKENKDKLKQLIIEEGFKFPVFVWIDHEEVFWINDGHQRQKVLAELEKDGWEVPPIPYVEIEAKNKNHAAELLLALNSRFGSINLDSNYLETYDIEGIEKYEIPELIQDGEEYDDDFEDAMSTYDNSNCEYPLIPKWDEKYNAVVIICETETEFAHIKSRLGVPEKARSYKNQFLGMTRVIACKNVADQSSEKED